jgi:hypothetical protein
LVLKKKSGLDYFQTAINTSPGMYILRVQKPGVVKTKKIFISK